MLVDQVADRLPARLDDVRDPLDALVQGPYLDEVVEDGLGARQAREAADRSGDRIRPCLLLRLLGVPRVGLQVEQTAIDLHVGRALSDRLDRRAERLVVEHASVDEPRLLRGELGELVEAEVLSLERVEVDWARRAEPGPEVGEAHGREDARDAGRRPGRERQRAVGILAEVVFAVVSAVAEGEHVTVARVDDRVRVGERHLPSVAEEVRYGHEELELVPLGHE